MALPIRTTLVFDATLKLPIELNKYQYLLSINDLRVVHFTKALVKYPFALESI